MPPPSWIASTQTHTAPLSPDTRKRNTHLAIFQAVGDRLPLTPMRSVYGLRMCHDFVFLRICSLVYVRLASLLYHIQVEPDHMLWPPLRVRLLHGTLYFSSL